MAELKGNFPEFLQALLQDFTRADLQFQADQQEGYARYLTQLPEVLKVGETPKQALAGKHLEVSEVTFKFTLGPKPKTHFAARWRAAWKALRGKRTTAGYYLADYFPAHPKNEGLLEVVLTVKKDQGGHWQSELQPKTVEPAEIHLRH